MLGLTDVAWVLISELSNQTAPLPPAKPFTRCQAGGLGVNPDTYKAQGRNVRSLTNHVTPMRLPWTEVEKAYVYRTSWKDRESSHLPPNDERGWKLQKPGDDS